MKRPLLFLVPVIIAVALASVAASYRREAKIRDAQVATRELSRAIGPLADADRNRQLSVIQALLERGADFKVRGRDGMTVMHLVAAMPCDEPQPSGTQPGSAQTGSANPTAREIDACEEQRVALLSRLAERGADVDAREEDGTTPLMEAVDYIHPQAVRALLAKGAKVNLRREGSAVVFRGNGTALQLTQDVLNRLAQPPQYSTVAVAPQTVSPQQAKQEYDEYVARMRRDTREIIALLKKAGGR